MGELGEIFDLADHARFLHSLDLYLAPVDQGLRARPGTEPSELLEMIHELSALFMTAHTVTYLGLQTTSAASIARVIEMCRLVGARRTEEYLHAVTDAFPGGRLPEDEDEFSEAVVTIDESEEGKSHWSTLDRKFPEAMEDLAIGLRAYLRPRIGELFAMRSAAER